MLTHSTKRIRKTFIAIPLNVFIASYGYINNLRHWDRFVYYDDRFDKFYGIGDNHEWLDVVYTYNDFIEKVNQLKLEQLL